MSLNDILMRFSDDKDGKSLIAKAIYEMREGNREGLEVLKAVIARGDDVNRSGTPRHGEDGMFSPLGLACEIREPELRNEAVELLILHGANVNDRDPFGVALDHGYIDTAKKLYSAGADIRPALVEACKYAATHEQDGDRSALNTADKKLEFLRECGAGRRVEEAMGGKIGSLNAYEVQRVLANNLARMDNKAKEVEKPNVPTQPTLNPASVKNHYSGRS
ncbi:MAG: hypothetical protein IJV75_03255 [Alphaproteobacteria bacterium]|nr:hypothetical protein [Alphaproteobacteria bacterium]